jgi:uncharacterized protein (DUF2147 family)
MIMKKALCLASLWLLAPVSVWAASDDILGVWNTAEGRSRVEVYQCADRYCGKIIWLKEPLYPQDDANGMAGKSKVDRENPDPAKREQPLLGLQILQDFRYDGDKWQEGTIYDPKEGKTYKCKITMAEDGKLHVRGYIGISLFGRTTEWTR